MGARSGCGKGRPDVRGMPRARHASVRAQPMDATGAATCLGYGVLDRRARRAPAMINMSSSDGLPRMVPVRMPARPTVGQLARAHTFWFLTMLATWALIFAAF